MCSPNIVFLSMLSPTETQSLYQTFSILQALLWTCSFTSLQVTTLKMMDKLNAQIRPLSNISTYTVITNKITGSNFYLLQSSLITILQVLLSVSLCPLLIRDIIRISLFTLNIILLSPKPITLLQISMSYRVFSKLKSLQLNSVIRSLLMCDILLLLISKQMTKSLSRLSSSKLLGLQRNSLKNISDPTKLFSSPVHYCSSSVSQSLCALSIQFSMCLCLNLLHPTLFPREHNWPLLQL